MLWLWSLLACLCQFQTMQVPSLSRLEDALLLRYAMALSPRQTYAKDWTMLWLWSLLACLCQFQTMQVPSLSRLEDALLLRYSMALSPRQTYA